MPTNGRNWGAENSTDRDRKKDGSTEYDDSQPFEVEPFRDDFADSSLGEAEDFEEKSGEGAQGDNDDDIIMPKVDPRKKRDGASSPQSSGATPPRQWGMAPVPSIDGGMIPPSVPSTRRGAGGGIDYSKLALTCGIYGTANLVQGALVGSAFGALQAAVMKISGGLDVSAFTVVKNSGIQFGAWLGVYSTMKCTLRLSRNKEDLLNTFGSGFVAGCVTNLRLRKPALIVIQGAVSGTVVTMVETFMGLRL
jgi:hypothetical protein